MPKVDMDQETGTIVEWCSHNGDEVKEGDVILVIETDKVAVDVEAPGSGILDGISAEPGDVIPIGTVIAYILSPGEELPEKGTLRSIEVEVAPTPIPEKPVQATPVAKKMADAYGIDLSTITPSGKGEKITKADVEAHVSSLSTQEKESRVNATPAARRVARENQVDLKAVQGSGPKGRIQESDVLAFIFRDDAVKPHVESQIEEPEVIPLIGIRRTIAKRMTASYQNIPHINFTSRVNMVRFIEARKNLNYLAEKRGDQKISMTGLFVKLVADTLSRHPFLNSSLIDGAIHLHKDINIGIAVALKNGLIVPVVKMADKKNIAAIAVEVDDLVNRAREGNLTNADVNGGTFTLSNLGPFGIEQFDAIINPPEAAILAIGATQLEAIPDEDGQITPCPVMRITLSADHRIVDGAVAARFVADLRAVLEEPILL